jgi:nucleoside-diphosphate-sugar epimerase
MPRKVLMTGAAGRIGTGFREEYLRHYQDAYELVLGIHHTDPHDERFATPTIVDVGEIEELRKAFTGIDTVVHLAANADWQADFCAGLLGPNVVGTYHVFEAARLAGCRRIVYASSVHAIMGYPVDYQAHAEDPPRPDTLYGTTKVFGEALCSSYAYCHGLSCIAIRIGAYISEADWPKLRQSNNPQQLDIAVSQRDLSQLIHLCIQAPESVHYGIVNGLSNNRFKRMDLESTKQLLGYEPQDDAFHTSMAVHLGQERKV